jgi:hypothetical protein
VDKKVIEKPTSKQILQYAKRLIARQKRDDRLFFKPQYITEANLQQALRELYCIISGDIYYKTLQ